MKNTRKRKLILENLAKNSSKNKNIPPCSAKACFYKLGDGATHQIRAGLQLEEEEITWVGGKVDHCCTWLGGWSADGRCTWESGRKKGKERKSKGKSKGKNKEGIK